MFVERMKYRLCVHDMFAKKITEKKM